MSVRELAAQIRAAAERAQDADRIYAGDEASPVLFAAWQEVHGKFKSMLTTTSVLAILDHLDAMRATVESLQEDKDMLVDDLRRRGEEMRIIQAKYDALEGRLKRLEDAL